MTTNSQEPSNADRFGHKLTVAAVATIGHAIYLALKYLATGRFNEVNLIALAVMAILTALGLAYFLYLRRRENKPSRDWRVSGDSADDVD